MTSSPAATAPVLYVAVIGPSQGAPHEIERAEAVGRALAQRGAILVCGGLGGAMEAACRGAKAGGGTTVGILPGSDRSAANGYVDVAVATGLGEARNAIVAGTADAVIAVGGAYGTLSEIALALGAGTPVVGLATWRLSRDEAVDQGIVVAATPEEAAELALALAPAHQT